MWVISDLICLIRIKLNNVSLHEAKTVAHNEMSACPFITVERRVSIVNNVWQDLNMTS